MSNGYIYCKALGGLNDSLNQLYKCLLYAVKYQKSIILELEMYKSSNFMDFFDFSNFNVQIYPISKLKEITFVKTEPDFYLDVLKQNKIPKFTKFCGWHYDYKIPIFDKNRKYSNDILLIHESCGGGNLSYDFFKKIKFTSSFLQILNEQFNTLPPIYDAIHIRYTDSKFLYDNFNEFYNKIIKFIESSPNKIYVASDSKNILENINSKYNSKIIKTKACDFIEGSYSSLHFFGNTNNSILINALIDLLILAKSNNLMHSVGGYSILAKSLWYDKNIVYNLLNPDLPPKIVSNKNYFSELIKKHNNKLLLLKKK